MRLKAGVNNLLVCVESAGTDNVGIVNARTDPNKPGPWEEIHVEQRPGNGRLALYVIDDAGNRRYFSAQPDGSLVCNRVKADVADPAIPADLKQAIGQFEECEEVGG